MYQKRIWSNSAGNCVNQEMRNTLKWMRLKKSFRKISKEMGAIDKESYFKELENIRESAWNEYKDGL